VVITHNTFPWLINLSTHQQRRFFEEMSVALRKAQTTGTMPGVLVSPQTYIEHLEPVLSAWMSTAEINKRIDGRDA
jgi:hypothetical protein